MHKIDTSTAVAGEFVDKNPSLGIEGTVVDASWLNAVQDEICNTITGAGDSLSKNSNGQLFAATQKLINKTVKRSALVGIAHDGSVDSTEKTVGDLIGIAYDNIDWFLSASIFVKVKTPASGAVLTVKVKMINNNVAHEIYTSDILATTEKIVTLPVVKKIPYANGQLCSTVVSTATVTAELIVQGYTSII